MPHDNGYDYRMAELERDVRELQKGIAPVPVHEQRLNTQDEAIRGLKRSVDGLIMAVLVAAMTVAGSTAAIILTGGVG